MHVAIHGENVHARAWWDGGRHEFLLTTGVAVGATDRVVARDLQREDDVEARAHAGGSAEAAAGVVGAGSPPVAILGSAGFAQGHEPSAAGHSGQCARAFGQRQVFAVAHLDVLKVDDDAAGVAIDPT